MKNVILRVVVLACCLSFVASAVYAVCWYPRWVRTSYWQYHSTCAPNCQPGQPYSDWWSLDGECFTDCDGVTTCEGDTEVRYRTQLTYERGQCDPICE